MFTAMFPPCFHLTPERKVCDVSTQDVPEDYPSCPAGEDGDS